MNVFEKLKNFLDTNKKSAPAQYYNVGGVGRGSFTEYLLGGSGQRMSAVQAMRFYKTASAVAIAVDKISDCVEQIKPIIFDIENKEVITNHPILDLINKPNGFETRDEFIGQVCRHWLLTHDSIVYAEGVVSSPPSSLFAVKPQDVTIQENMVDKYPRNYNISQGISRGNYLRETAGASWIYTDVNLRQVYQIRGFSSTSVNTYSDSPLEAIALEIKQQLNGRYHNLKLLENGGRLSLIAIFKNDLDEPQRQARSQALNEHMAGPQNAGRIAVVTADDMELKEAGTNTKDMDYANLEQVSAEVIFKRYNIPLPLVNNDASTDNNMGHSVFHFFDWAVLPAFGKCYSGIGDMLFPRYGMDGSKFKITYNPNDIDALRMRMIEELSKMKADNAITTNEYRNTIGKEDVEGGDVIREPANMIPINEELFNLNDVDTPKGK